MGIHKSTSLMSSSLMHPIYSYCIYIYIYIIWLKNIDISVYIFFVNPSKLPYRFYNVRWESVDKASIIFCFPCTCLSTYIHKRPNIGNALREPFTGTQSEKDGSNKARVLSHMSLGVISTKLGVRRTNLTIIWVSTTLFKTSKDDVNQPNPKFWLDSKKYA